MPAPALSHHEILGLIEPFTRRGQRIDLAASDRAARRLRFKAIDHADTAEGLPPRRESLQLDSLGDGRFRLIRTLSIGGALHATLEAEGSDLGELLAQVDAVPHQRQLLAGPGYLIARCHRIEWLPAQRGRSAKLQRLVFASAAASVDGFALSLAMSRVTGIPAHLLLTPTRAGNGAQPGTLQHASPDAPADELPDDLLAVLGHSWARLIRVKDGWQGDLRLKGHMPDRGDDAQAKFDLTVAHLARTLAEPPALFHQRQLRARWQVVARRAVPLAASLGLIAGAFAVPGLQLAQDSVFRMLIFHAPPLLLVGFFCMRELPRIEIPRLPKPLRGSAWRANPAGANHVAPASKVMGSMR